MRAATAYVGEEADDWSRSHTREEPEVSAPAQALTDQADSVGVAVLPSSGELRLPGAGCGAPLFVASVGCFAG